MHKPNYQRSNSSNNLAVPPERFGRTTTTNNDLSAKKRLFRRSNSASNIPVGKGRASSQSRTSTKSTTSNTGAKPKMSYLSMGGSSERPKARARSSSQDKAGYLRPSGISDRSSALRRNPSTTPMGKSPMKNLKRESRLPNDRDWVSTQYSKVCAFFRSYDFGEEIVKNLKPPITIKIFVEVMQLFMDLISPKFKQPITINNYIVSIIKYAKASGYTGQLTKSLMQTVNTKHNWNHVVSLFSWFVDIILLINKAEDVSEKDAQLISLNKTLFTETFCLKPLENEPDYEEKINARMNYLIDNIRNVLEIDVEKMDNLKSERDEQKKEYVKVEEKNAMLRAHATELENENKELGSLCQTLTNEIYNKEKYYTDENKEYEEKKLTIVTATQEAKTAVTELKEIISTQTYSFEEKRKLENVVNEKIDTIETCKKQTKSIQKLKEEYDFTYPQLRKKIESIVWEENGKLVKSGLVYPEVHSLKLPQEGYYTAKFLDEITDILTKTKTLQEKIQTENSALKNKLDNQLQIEKELLNTKKVICEKNNDFKTQLDYIVKEIADTEIEYDNVVSQFSIEKNELEEKCRLESLKMPDLKATFNLQNEKVQEKLAKEKDLAMHNYLAEKTFAARTAFTKRAMVQSMKALMDVEQHTNSFLNAALENKHKKLKNLKEIAKELE